MADNDNGGSFMTGFLMGGIVGAVIGLLLLLVTGIIVAGYVIIFVLPPRQLVVRVDDVSYTRGDLVKILRVRQAETEFLGSSYSV